MLTRFSVSTAVTAAVVLTVAACSNKDRGGMADTTAMVAPPAAATTDSAMAAGGGAMGGAMAGETGGLTDANIVYILDQANASDSARGKLAESKGTSADVKKYGALMVGEHHALRVAGMDLAKKLAMTPQMPTGDQSESQAKAEMDSLTSMAKGAAWDRAYIDFEVNYHKAVIETANKALAAAQNPELKALIKSAAPTLQHHLQRAEQIQKAMTAS